MKNFFLILFVLCIFLNSYSQINTNPLIGHYYYCTDEGYQEIFFADSVFRYLNPGMSNSFAYKILSDYEFVNLGIKDTLEYFILSKDEIIVKSKDDAEFYFKDTYTRFNKKIPNYLDHNCEMKISSRVYNQMLWQQYYIREYVYGQSCKPDFLNSFYEDILDIKDLIFPTFDAFSFNEKSSYQQISSNKETQKNLEIMQYKTQLITTKNSPIAEKTFRKISYNKSYTEAILEIDEFGYCYEYYNFITLKTMNNALQLVGQFPNEKEAKCLEKCHLRHFILLEVDGKIEFNEIFMNRTAVKIR